MDEYISLQAVLDIVMQYCPDDDGSCSKADVDFREMLDEIEALPTADVQPVIVIHSRWIPTGDGTYNAYCENCGQERGSKSWNKNDFKYCFGCGARMDGDSK